jgi:hypothetical protein
MSDGLQLYIGEDGSKILFEASTGKRYTLLEHNYTYGNINYQFQPNNYGYYQDGNTMSIPHTDQIRPNILQSQMNYTSESHIQDQSNKTIPQKTPSQTLSSQQAITCQNMLQHNTPYHVHQHENTSTPTQTEQAQEWAMEEENDESQQNTATKNKRALNDSDEFITVISNKSKKKTQRNETTQKNQHQNQNKNQQTTTMSNTDKNQDQNKYNVPIEQLQRAIAHNLPCFSITFREPENLPSAVVASEGLYEHFERHQTKLNSGFSVVRYIGNQLKVGVKYKEDYQTLCNHKVWPTEIQNKKISVQMPKFTPEQFSLVVRYIPPEFSIEQVAKEVKRSASTADNFRIIIYSYSRKTNNYRFTVSDIKEYNGLLRLGHIGIGNKMQIVTPYRPANKLTYCSKCWRLGHLRNQCPEFVQKCRFCLLDYKEKHNDICSKQFKCAQCSSDHFSLDADCQKIQQYRNNLNRAVKQAVKDGAIKITQVENTQPSPTPPPNQNNRNFPLLPSASVNHNTVNFHPWKKNSAYPVNSTTS